MVGSSISHYKILSKLGQGGMGVVYRAEDTKLERPVALKFLPNHLLGDADVRKRFHREARAAAALDHPNVCHVYEIDEAEGHTFIAMSLLEGESLDKRIGQGPLKLEDALSIGGQIASGLEAAHEKGVHHRDIKPENIMVDAKGHVTIMDFGLARLSESSRLTRTDETVGTVAYMSPEQTQGSEVDHRTDIWSLGVVIYEMVTGQKPFKGAYDKAVMYSILNEEPEPVTAVRTGVPMELEVFVGKCLSKDPEARYRAVGETAVDLATVAMKLESGRSQFVRSQAPSTRRPAPPGSGWLPWALLSVATLAFAALSFVHFTQKEPPRPVRRFVIAPSDVESQGLSTSQPVISPNGQHIVFSIRGEDGGLWIRSLAQTVPRPVADTPEAHSPFWSPDSLSIGFFARGDLRRVDLQGSPSIRVCELPAGDHWDGATWGPDGETIVFSADHKLWEVPARGGDPTLIVEAEDHDSAAAFEWPRFLPNDAEAKLLMFQRVVDGGSSQTFENSTIVRNLDTGDSVNLPHGMNPSYSPSGHILYGSGDSVWALPFSPDKLQATGEAFIVAQDSTYASVSSDGTLVVISSAFDATERLIWRDRQGNKVGEIGRPQRRIGALDLSHDGSRVVAEGRETPGEAEEIWIHEVDRPVSRQLTFDPAEDQRPVWSPDGKTVVFTRGRQPGQRSVLLQRADSGGETNRVELPPEHDGKLGFVFDWFPDGRRLLYRPADQELDSDVWLLILGDNGAPNQAMPFLGTRFRDYHGEVSPDGRFVAYMSGQGGARQVFVMEIEGGSLWQISEREGWHPRWSPDGKELYFFAAGALVAAEIDTTGEFRTGKLERLFSVPSWTPYDVSPDGRFVMVEEFESQAAITVTENWYEEFRDRE